MKEVWKSCKGYEGSYEVSNLGRIKSKQRISEKMLTSHNNKYGYPSVTLSIRGKITRHTIHQLMAIAFLDHTPNGNTMVVDHIDEVKTNNHIDNLRIISNRENCSRSTRGTSKFTGVSWNKQNKRWIACIEIEGKQKHLGSFTDELEASEMYKKELKKIVC